MVENRPADDRDGCIGFGMYIWFLLFSFVFGWAILAEGLDTLLHRRTLCRLLSVDWIYTSRRLFGTARTV